LLCLYCRPIGLVHIANAAKRRFITCSSVDCLSSAICIFDRQAQRFCKNTQKQAVKLLTRLHVTRYTTRLRHSTEPRGVNFQSRHFLRRRFRDTSHVQYSALKRKTASISPLLYKLVNFINPLDSKGSYSATSNNAKLVGPPINGQCIYTLAVDGWAVTFSIATMGLGGLWWSVALRF